MLTRANAWIIGFGLVSLGAGTASSSPTDFARREAGASVSISGDDSAENLELARSSGNIAAQRSHIWKVFSALTHSSGAFAEPAFQSWYGEDEAFAKTPNCRHLRGIESFSRASEHPTPSGGTAHQSSDSALISYTLYNASASAHIRQYRLNSVTELQQLRKTGALDLEVKGDRSIPQFPADSVVLKTVWWPVAREGITALPVWDPEHNAARSGGNSYVTWDRLVGLDPTNRPERSLSIDFAGRTFPSTPTVNTNRLYEVTVDESLAGRLMRDPQAHKSALIALGRPLKGGDRLVLIGLNLATRELQDWIWAAFWWHDKPNEGAFASGRPTSLGSVWNSYLMQVAFDSEAPRASDGGPHICFNPWLEGRFPDQGVGGGINSNCMSCHRRASYPPIPFLPVTRGRSADSSDAAFAPNRLRTSFLWSIAMHARP